MRILLTGYPGWLVNRFLETRSCYSTPLEHIRCLVHPSVQIVSNDPSVDIVRGDLSDSHALSDACEGVDVVVHAAGVLHVKKISDFYKVNRDGTQNLIEQAVQKHVPRFIFISSNAAQGFCNDPQHPLTEQDPCNPASHYGRSKREAEVLIQKYFDAGKINAITIRPAMFYGPPVPTRHVDIFKRVMSGSFPVFGDGHYLRSVTHIDNLMDAIHLILNKPEIRGETYGITDARIPTLLEIIDAMSSALGAPVKIQRFPRFMADIADYLDRGLSAIGIYWMLPHLVGESHRHIACRIDKARRELGYEARHTLNEGYRDAVQWCRNNGELKA